MNNKMQNNMVEASKAYLSAVRVLRVYDIEGDEETLVPFVHSLVDAGFRREEILEVAERMGQLEGEWIDIIADSALDERPWMSWGRSLN